MNPIELLHKSVMQTIPEVSTTVRSPGPTTSMWLLEVTLNGYTITVKWGPTAGFIVRGKFGLALDGSDLGPLRLFKSMDHAAATKYAVQILQTKGGMHREEVKTEYTVRWVIEIDAPNPLTAAREARRIMRDPDNTGLVFEVESPPCMTSSKTTTTVTTTIDLEGDVDPTLEE